MTNLPIEAADRTQSGRTGGAASGVTTTFHDAETNEVLGSTFDRLVAVGDGVVGFGRRRFRVVDLWLSLDEGGPLADGVHVWVRELVHPTHPADPTVAAMSAEPPARRHDEPLRLDPEYFGAVAKPPQ